MRSLLSHQLVSPASPWESHRCLRKSWCSWTLTLVSCLCFIFVNQRGHGSEQNMVRTACWHVSVKINNCSNLRSLWYHLLYLSYWPPLFFFFFQSKTYLYLKQRHFLSGLVVRNPVFPLQRAWVLIPGTKILNAAGDWETDFKKIKLEK